MLSANEQTQRQFVCWHNLEVFGLPQSEQDVCDASVPDGRTRFELARVLALPTLVVYEFLSGLGMKGTVHERWLIGRIAEVELEVLSLSSFSN